MMVTQFSKQVIDELKYYVYIYSDPDTEEIFYVGKGKGNRVFSHLNEQTESEKIKKINAIRGNGKEPKIEILLHGIDDEITALKVEASVIDLLGKDRLTNKVRGWQSALYGRIEISKLVSYYERESIEIPEKAILIRINQLFRFGMSDIELYDATRGIWKVGQDREKVDYAFSIFDGIIQQVYKIEKWFPAGTTFSTRGALNDPGRFEFVGKIADADIINKYIGKSVEHYFPKNSQNPIMYLNVKRQSTYYQI
ncbi:hypothetical protein SAMN04487897_103336 [Paenibacillus sp. yr247]|uniref:LEM-3-like GIY-YIG domain-containing protein n=1 Tax=Paenibacillus sp. yr247 TaxID=1761880 RepID=UPI00088B2622|nr:hypothetical protein [Paenibacillus sp. yr247]SDN61158.1 hypothetical protein SAMN04487897_103336 [Paenibacillus sp. yr247]